MSSETGVPPVLQAASLKRGERTVLVGDDGGVPPVLQAASLKLGAASENRLRQVRRSACIAGGLIEAAGAGEPLAILQGRVPPVLQAASLKRVRPLRGTTALRAFRLYCRRPH